MTFDPARLAGLTDDVVRAYTEAEVHLLEIIANAVGKGRDKPTWATDKLAEIRRVRVLAAQQVQLLATTGPQLAATAVLRGWETGEAGAVEDIEKIRGVRFAAAGTSNYRAVNALVAETAKSLDTAHRAILRGVEDEYRAVIRSVVAAELAGGATSRQVQQAALDRWAAKGITSFTDARGRKWSMSAYAEMAVRTATHRAALAGHDDLAVRNGYDLVRVSSHLNPAPVCAPYERQVLSLSGTRVGEVDIGGGETVFVKASMAEAERRGLHHPNCRHTHSIYVPGTKISPPPMPDEQGYRDTQRQRALERRIRAWKRREAVALDPEAKAYAAKYRKAAQADMRAHLERTGLARRGFREQLRDGDAATGKSQARKVYRRTRKAKAELADGPTPIPDPTPATKKPPTVVAPPEPGQPSHEILARVQAARAATPKTKAEWDGKLGRKTIVPTDAEIDGMLAQRRVRYARRVEDHDKNLASYQLALDDEIARGRGDGVEAEFLRSRIAQETSRRDYAVKELEEFDRDKPKLGEILRDRHTRSLYDYQLDAKGNRMPSKALSATLDEHLELGHAIRKDLERVYAADSELVELRAAAQYASTLSEKAFKAREREAILTQRYMRGLRDFDAGPEQPVAKPPAGFRSDTTGGMYKENVATFREAEKFFPSDWREKAAARGKLYLGRSKSDRAFFSDGFNGQPDLITAGKNHYNYGGLADYRLETMVHELGHRMETAIEALPQLEYALVYRRATDASGNLEGMSTLYKGTSEKARRDKWPEGYTGKDYSEAYGLTDNPAATPAWELFQTGLQSFYARNPRFADPDLDAFVAAVVAVL